MGWWHLGCKRVFPGCIALLFSKFQYAYKFFSSHIQIFKHWHKLSRVVTHRVQRSISQGAQIQNSGKSRIQTGFGRWGSGPTGQTSEKTPMQDGAGTLMLYYPHR